MDDYVMRLNKEQLQIIRAALEEYFRLRIGQFDYLADDLAFIHFDYANYTKDDFDYRIQLRDEITRVNEDLFRKIPLRPAEKQTKNVRNAIDMWHVIRHQEWLEQPLRDAGDVRSAISLQLGTEPFIKLEKESEKKT